MKIIKIILLLLLLFMISSCGKKLQSHWTAQVIAVDGLWEDWQDIPLEYNEDFNLMYGLANNDSALFVTLRFSDPRLARSFAGRGLTLWFDGANKKKKTAGIHYEDPAMRGQRFIGLRPGKAQETPVMNRKLIPKGQFTFAYNDSLTGIRLSGLNHWQAAANVSDGVYCYEFRIPLNRDEASGVQNLFIKEDNLIRVCIEQSGIDKEELAAMREKMREKQGGAGMTGGAGRAGGRRGGMMGGGRSGRRPGGMMDGGNRLMTGLEGKELWFSVQLAGRDKN